MKTEEMKKKAKAAKEKKQKKNRGGAGDGLFFDSKSKTWGFRAVRDGKDNRRKGFKTKTEAKEARILFLANRENEAKAKEEKTGVYTFQDVYDHYMTYGTGDKREKTIIKQESLWRCHLSSVWSDKDINKTSPQEINNYLSMLYSTGDDYTDHPLAYESVKGVLKFFYLFYGYARRMEWISSEKYFIMCNDENTYISMPTMTQEDAEDEDNIETYTIEEINRMRDRIKDSSLYLAFEIGYYMGLRISETFGLMWQDIDFKNKKMTVKRQMIKSGVHRVLVPVKTVKANRVIDIPDKLLILLQEHKEQQEQNKIKYGSAYKNTETVRDRQKKGQDDPLTSGDFINRMDDGTLLSSDSMKSWSKKFKAELGIPFKYHNLRHTHASTMAALNMPLFSLMDRLGHKKVETTRKYYVGVNEIADERAKQIINQI